MPYMSKEKSRAVVSIVNRQAKRKTHQNLDIKWFPNEDAIERPLTMECNCTHSKGDLFKTMQSGKDDVQHP